MSEEQILIFGYGSLMNEESHTKTVGCEHSDRGFVLLGGYERVFNLSFNGSVYCNIQVNREKTIIGKIIGITREGLDNLFEREVGYELVDVSGLLSHDYHAPVFTFVAPYADPQGTIKQSYINKCLQPLPVRDRQQWIDDSIIESEIEKDVDPIET